MSALIRDERILWRRSGERVLLSCPGADDLIVLEGSACLLWELLAEPVAEQELSQAMHDCFYEDAGTVDAQVRAFVSSLLSHEAVRPT